jgi:hypothetical protein
MRSAALIATVGIALGLPTTATAKCALLSESESRQASDVVFEGIVGGHVGDSAEATLTPGKPTMVRRFDHFRFRVARYLRGEGQGNVQVTRPLLTDSYPRADPRPGEIWRVYARRTPRGLFFSPCVPYTSRLEGAAAARVGEGLADAGDGEDDDDGLPLLPLALAALAVLVLLALVAVRLRRAR